MNDSAAAADGWITQIRFDSAGLVPVVAQDAVDRRVLILAWAVWPALTGQRRESETAIGAH